MTVSARPANHLPATANIRSVDIRSVDLRQGTVARAGTYPFDGDDVVSGWHTHDLHQIEYAFQGVVEVETEAAHYLLPPQQAVWIPAGLAHRTTLRRVRTVSVFFHPDFFPDFHPHMAHGAGDRARVLAAAPVIREMILYGVRWPIDRPIDRPDGNRAADAFFETLAYLVLEWLDHETPLCLPTSSDPVVAAVMAYTGSHLDSVTAQGVCRAVGLSERTLRRRFSEATGMTWHQYRLESRLLRSMSLLAEPGPSILAIANRVGFESAGAFARAFGRYTGETPSQYRARATTPIRETVSARRP